MIRLFCDWCKGKRYLNGMLCPKCNGEGYVEVEAVHLRTTNEVAVRRMAIGVLLAIIAIALYVIVGAGSHLFK